MSDSRREALEAAFDEHAEEDETTGEVREIDPADKPELAEPGDDAPIVDPKLADEKPKLDAEGKPIAETVAEKPLPTDGKSKKVVKEEPSPFKAPASWRPEKREKFASAPREVQEEITRREAEMDGFVRQTAQQRQYAGRLNQLIQPYEAMIRAEGGDHFTAVDNLLKTAYHLRTANPQTKATMVAQMIAQHGVDINLLDGALAQVMQGKQPNQQQQDPNIAYLQRELAPLKEFMTGLQSRQQQVQQQDVERAFSEVESLANDPNYEYFNDVRPIMADLMDTATKYGQKMTLQDAYQRATLAHPTISTLVLNKRMSDTAAQRSAAARKARGASASLPSGGAPAGAADQGAAKPKTRRSAIEAAWDTAEQSGDN